jgi:Kef-type K+ transport system membrane component KefB
MFETYIIIGLCLLVILSYFYNLIGNNLRIPSVLLLLGTGVLCKWLATYYGLNFVIPTSAISIFGSVGLILIVLEGTMDIKFDKSKLRLLASALLVCIFLVVCSTIAISWLIVYVTGSSWHNALLYGISLSVISSAIVIPTVESMAERTREFMLYESVLSDIIGIVIFNVIAYNPKDINAGQYITLGWQMVLMLVVSVIFSLIMVWLLAKIKTRVRFYLIIAIMILIYESGNLFHLSSLLLILCFGLVLNNLDLLDKYLLNSKRKSLEHAGKRMFKTMQAAYTSIEGFRPMVLETSFVIRTFFFFMFGYSINVNGLLQPQILIFSGYILLIMYVLRFVNLRFFTRSHVFPEIFIYPRGLTTVLLYYSIPLVNRISLLNDNMFFTIVIVTNVLMMISVLFSKKSELKIEEDIFR